MRCSWAFLCYSYSLGYKGVRWPTTAIQIAHFSSDHFQSKHFQFGCTAGCFSIRKLDSLAPPPPPPPPPPHAPDVSTRKERRRSLGRDLFPDPMHHACEKRVWAMAMGTLPLAPAVPILDSQNPKFPFEGVAQASLVPRTCTPD